MSGEPVAQLFGSGDHVSAFVDLAEAFPDGSGLTVACRPGLRRALKATGGRAASHITMQINVLLALVSERRPLNRCYSFSPRLFRHCSTDLPVSAKLL
jgi:hypothetical protein